MLPSTPAATIPNRVRFPSETLNPANSMIASLGTGMHALSSAISRNTPGSPVASMTSVATSTIGLMMKSAIGSRRLVAAAASAPGWNLPRGGAGAYGPGDALYTHPAPVQRLNDPVYRHRLLQFLADAVVAALAFFLAFQLRFLDEAAGIPDRYWTLLW